MFAKQSGDETWSSEFASSSFGIPADCSLVLISSFLTLIARRISIRTGLSHVVNHSLSIQTNMIVCCTSSIATLLSAFFYSRFALAFISHACVNLFHSLQVRHYLQLRTKGEADLCKVASKVPFDDPVRHLFAPLVEGPWSKCTREKDTVQDIFIFGHVSFKSFFVFVKVARGLCASL